MITTHLPQRLDREPMLRPGDSLPADRPAQSLDPFPVLHANGILRDEPICALASGCFFNEPFTTECTVVCRLKTKGGW